jgi:uncharacterized protein YyaL (SSP411 family)
VVPHFEKMLYDNALLLRAYLHWWRLTGSATGWRIAEETCDFMVSRLGTPEGGLASALDADTVVDGHSVEGATYVWTPQQLQAVLGPEDGAWVAELTGVTEQGTFEHGTSTLQLLRDVWVEGAAERAAGDERWRSARERLRAARATRPQPARDDKVVAAWNGLAIAALAECGALLDRPDLVEAARRAASLLLEVHVVDGSLRRVSRDGSVGAPQGVLEDYADVVEGLLALHAATGEPRWLDGARPLVLTILDRFWRPGGDGGGDRQRLPERGVRRRRGAPVVGCPHGGQPLPRGGGGGAGDRRHDRRRGAPVRRLGPGRR